jgi:hypothetical protein
LQLTKPPAPLSTSSNADSQKNVDGSQSTAPAEITVSSTEPVPSDFHPSNSARTGGRMGSRGGGRFGGGRFGGRSNQLSTARPAVHSAGPTVNVNPFASSSSTTASTGQIPIPRSVVSTNSGSGSEGRGGAGRGAAGSTAGRGNKVWVRPEVEAQSQS